MNLINGDCLDIMPEIETGSIDMILADLPYGITKAKWDKRPINECFNEIFRVSKKQIIFGGHWFDLPKKDGWIIWNKMPFLKTTNQAEFIWTSFLTKNKIIDFTYAGNVIGNTKKPNYKIKKVMFTSQKPVQFIELLLKLYSEENQTILDPMMGTGTTGVACIHTGREFIGIEKDSEYFETAKRRIENINPLFQAVA